MTGLPERNIDRIAARVPLDEFYRLLSNERRRVALDQVADRRKPIAIEELAAEIARLEGQRGDRRDEVLATLHHVHVPMLADAGIVDYDRETGRITPRTGIETLTG